MKKLIIQCLVICTFLFTLTSCSRAEVPSTTKEDHILESDTLQNNRVLIVYLSRTKNTRALAEIIRNKIGGDLVELELLFNPIQFGWKNNNSI
ncbi:MAG: hypothetical protein WC623_19845 [Pedobacter sp.]|uniref:hypothetical protein n=1 Tax=Pedobacter sp. TaxID=1411316 RepID=UPI0035660A15